MALRPGTQLTTLYALVKVLGVPIASLFEAEAEDDPVKEPDRALLLPLRRLLLPVARPGGDRPSGKGPSGR